MCARPKKGPLCANSFVSYGLSNVCVVCVSTCRSRSSRMGPNRAPRLSGEKGGRVVLRRHFFFNKLSKGYVSKRLVCCCLVGVGVWFVDSPFYCNDASRSNVSL